MTPTGRYLVMRYGALIGYSAGRRLITVSSRHVLLDTALMIAAAARRSSAGASAFWIVEVGRPAAAVRKGRVA